MSNTMIPIKTTLALAAVLLSSASHAGPVSVNSVYSEGYGLAANIEASVSASTPSITTPSVTIPGVLGLPGITIPGITTPGITASGLVNTNLVLPSLVNGSSLAGYNSSASTVSVNAGASFSGAPLLSVLSLLGIGPDIAAASGTLYGGASYVPATGVVRGVGGVENLALTLGPLLSFSAIALETASTVTVNAITGQLIGGTSFTTSGNASLFVLGVQADAFAGLFSNPNFNLAQAAANTVLNFNIGDFGIGLGGLVDGDLALRITLNELRVNGLAAQTADCGLGALSCQVETNAVHIALSSLLNADAGGLLPASIDDYTNRDVLIGHSLARASITPRANNVPEPSSAALALIALAGVGGSMRSRRRATAS